MRTSIVICLSFIMAVAASAAVAANAAVTGTVMTPAGQPVAGATVSFHRVEFDDARRARLMSGAAENAPIASVTTAANGTFSLDAPKESAPVGFLQVEAPGFETSRRLVEMNDESGAIVLQKATPVKGRVTAAGKPVGGATVAATYATYAYTTTKDERGEYQLPSAKSLLSLAVIHRDYGVNEERTSEPRFDRSLTASTIEGRVVTESGAAVAGATVYVDGWPLATSSEDGAFTISAPAKWKVVSARKASLLGEKSSSSGKPLTIAVRKGIAVSGRITDSKSGMPVQGAIVSIAGRDALSAGFRDAVQTDVKGRYSVVVPKGLYNAYISHPAYMPDSKEIAASSADVARDAALIPRLRVSGTVVDEERKPVVGATVRLETGEMAMLGGATRFASRETSGISGPDGKFAVKVDPRGEGEMWLVAAKPGLPKGKSAPFKAAPGDRKSGIVVTVPAGIAVTGKVTDQDGNALPAVAVSVAESEEGKRDPMTRMFAAGPRSRPDDAVQTSADGTFTVRLSRGTYDFTFSREGFTDRTVRGQLVEPNQATSVDAVLTPSVAISGRVLREGAPVENVRVWSMGQANNAVTAADGSFTLEGLTAGPVQVLFIKSEEFIHERRSFTAPARDVVVDFDGGGTIKGRVVERETNKPVRDFSASIAIAGAGLRSSAGALKFTTDDGSFVLEHVPAGSVMVVVSAAGYAEGRRNADVENGKTISGVDMQLDTGVRLIGRVTGSDGSPVADARVMIPPSSTSGMSGSRSTTTDANGEYVLEGLAPADARVVVSHAKHPNAVKMVALKAPETRLDVQLSGGRKVTGVVVAADGAPVAQADVAARSSSGFKMVRSDSAGAFEFENLATGRYRFTATKEGFTTGSVDDVDTASTAPIRITLQPGATIYGRIIGLSADDLALAEVSAMANNDRVTAPVDASGNYRLTGAPVGTVRLTAEVRTQNMGTTKMSRPQTVDITPGGSRQVDLEFGETITVRGQIRRNGAPLQGGEITFVPRRGTEGGLTRGVIDEAGRYEISNLSEGPYSVSVSDSQRLAPYSTEYQVRGSGVFDIDYTTASIRGHVIDASTGDALANANVTVRGSAQTLRARTQLTDSVGEFVIDGVSPGTYNLTATKDGFGTSISDVQVGDRDVTGVEVKLSRADGVTMRIVDARDGRPMHARVIVFDGQGRLVSDEIGLSQGGSNLGEVKLRLAPGSYSASITAEGYAVRNVTLQSPSSPTIALTTGGTLIVRSRHPERLIIRLIDPTGVPYFRWSAGAASLELLPSPASRTIPNVAGGTYTIQLLDLNQTVLDAKQVTVQEGQTVTIEM